MNIFKPIAQILVNAALPAIKTGIAEQAALLAKNPQYAPYTAIVLPFLSDLLDNWTIKL